MKKSVIAGTAGLLLFTAACGGGSPNPASGPSTPVSTAKESPAAAPHKDNGIAKKPAKAILTAARRALAKATSVHLSGARIEKGDTVRIDMRIARTGAKGTVTGPIKGAMVPAQLLFIGGKSFMRGKSLWKASGGTTMANLIGDRWVLMPKGQGGPTDLANLKAMAASLKSVGPVSKGSKITIGGQPAIGVKTKDSVFYVAMTDTPYLLRISPLKGDKKKFESLTDYNAPLTIAAPAKPLDLAKLGHH
ncbi:MAG: hypothetical protein JWN52_4829 [Actinomycetia bacterium]|nr:hypothetical protein [Actinomycetes bacterium]